MLVDSHAHLDAEQFDGDRDEVLARASQAGVEEIITCGTNLASSRRAIEIAAKDGHIWATVGIHPHDAEAASEHPGPGLGLSADVRRRLCELAQHPTVVAVGEIGLDYHYDLSPRDKQQAVFADQLTLAAELQLPVVVHCREAEQDLVKVMEASPAPPGGVLHCFLGSRQLAEWALSRGFYLGVAGPITFRRMEALTEIMREAPLERLLVETDCPYMAPHPKRGRRNEPALLVHVAERLAQVHRTSLVSLATVTTANANELFHGR